MRPGRRGGITKEYIPNIIALATNGKPADLTVICFPMAGRDEGGEDRKSNGSGLGCR